MWNIKISLVGGVILRFGLLMFGKWQDSVMEVKFTDVDYHVFSDASKHVAKGESPYARPTYRYTPLLALMLLPNVYICELTGKIMFILCDLLTGLMIYKLAMRGQSIKTAVLCCTLWLLNPLPAVIASRGNADSIMTFLVLSTLHLFLLGYVKSSAVVFGLTVHWKIYPITYSLPMYLALTDDNNVQLLDLFWPNKKRRDLVFVSVFTFLFLTSIMYWQYGYEFLHESYVYHLTRRDLRHNFSPYFYLIYLTGNEGASVWLLGLITFLPQVVLLVAVSFYLYNDLPLCCLVQTSIFVAFNKVCTSQYFLWYLSILPAALPHIIYQPSTVLSSLLPWILSQGSWLFFAYQLEFEGQQVFLWLWLSSLLFLISHVGLISDFIKWSKTHKIQKVKSS
ncbi:GPI mannosyltransferase 1-like [Antedon mediterranea]|uniref:GPI mannosyltransferase 1-like n=1 Tax=Antedon mediterranea TaxID=105859 RepID=UPI003AF4ADA1